MRTRKLLVPVVVVVVTLCILAPLTLCQERKKWINGDDKDDDEDDQRTTGYWNNTVDGQFESVLRADGTKISEETMDDHPSRSTLEFDDRRSFDLSTVYRRRRAINTSSSMDGIIPGRTNVHQISNLPRSRVKPGEDMREKGRKYKNVTIGDGICQSVDIRNSVNYFVILQDCRVIEGFLQIVLIENGVEKDFQNISFPNLREITGYLLLYRVNGLKSLNHLFPNLEVIRGDILFTDYAFMVYEMQNLQEIGLTKLIKIPRGGVRIEKNPVLCYTMTLNWAMIVTAGENFIKDNSNETSCPGCSHCPDGHCWSAQHCQTIEKPKCHSQCLGDCNGTTESDCYVCKYYQHEGKCVEACPSHLYAYLSRRCLTKSECLKMNYKRKMFRIDDDLRYKQRWRAFNGSCITRCPEGYEDSIDVNNMTSCRVCKDRCRKISSGAIIRHISDAQDFRGTTVVNGALEFQIRNGNPNLMNELTEAFGLIEEISEYVKVTHSFPITSLSFFKKLKVIKGEKLDINSGSLVVLDNPNLSNLFPPAQKITILNGRLFFHYNPKLCLSKIVHFANMVGITNFTSLEVQPESNGEKVACNIVNINITVKEMGPNYVNLIWDSYKPPAGQQLFSYLLNYIETNSENVTYEVNTCGNNTWQIVDVDIPTGNFTPRTISKYIVGLKPYTRYAVYVKTFTSRHGTFPHAFNNPVGQSKIIFFITKDDVPSIPRNVVSVALSDTEILVKWSPPEYPNGPIDYYLISGVIKPENKELLASRDYCKYGLINEPESEELQEIPLKLLNGNPSSACCTEDDSDKTISSKKFEIFCHENLTISHLSPGWKDYCVFNRYNSMEDDLARTNNKHVELSEKDFIYNVSSSSNSSYVLKKLRHFSLYTITVAACRTRLKDNAQMCSSIQYTSVRTKERKNADNVYDIRTDALNDTIVKISWNSVKDPNALTVTYTLEYTNLNIKDAKKSTICIPREEFTGKRISHHIKYLVPGRYTVRVRSTSLAGDGAFSEVVLFSVGLSSDRALILILWLIVVCFVAIIIATYFYFRSLQRKRNHERFIASVNPDYIETQYIIDCWEVPRENVEILEEFGLGNFGMVYRGCMNKSIEVAIKTISREASDREKNEFLNEACVMKNFSTYHIIKLLGVVSKGNPPFVIMELMANGDLKTYLRRIRDTKLIPNSSKIIRMAAEIADGMAYIESKKFVHRDLAARNCMISKNLVCKIGDFGMARDIYETDYYKIGRKGLLPIRWMAPETLTDGVFTSDSDVWSFGVVMYEILTLAEIPYQGFSNDEVLNYVLRKGVLTTPRNCPQCIQKIMKKCFKWRANDRPTFMEIVAELEPFLGQDFYEKSFYHSPEAINVRTQGIRKFYPHAPPMRFHWGSSSARWVKEFEDNVILLDQIKGRTNRGRIFKTASQRRSNTRNLDDIPLNRRDRYT